MLSNNKLKFRALQGICLNNLRIVQSKWKKSALPDHRHCQDNPDTLMKNRPVDELLKEFSVNLIHPKRTCVLFFKKFIIVYLVTHSLI